MRDHARADQELPLGVVVDAPWIAEAVGDHLEDILRRMITPHATVDLDAVAGEEVGGEWILVLVETSLSGGLPDLRGCRVALQSVEPAVGSPVQAVDRFVAIQDAPARETNLDVRRVGLVIVIPIRYEQEIRGRPKEEAVEPDRDRRRKWNPFEKHLAAVGDAVSIAVFENQDATVASVREPLDA